MRRKHQLAVLAALDTMPSKRRQLVVSPIQLACAGSKEGVLNGRPEGERNVRFVILELERPLQSGLVDAVAPQEANRRPHSKRQAQQVWPLHGLGVLDRLFDAADRFVESAQVQQREGQSDQHRNEHCGIIGSLGERSVQEIGRLREAVIEQPYVAEPAHRLGPRNARLELRNRLLEERTGVT